MPEEIKHIICSQIPGSELPKEAGPILVYWEKIDTYAIMQVVRSKENLVFYHPDIATDVPTWDWWIALGKKGPRLEDALKEQLAQGAESVVGRFHIKES